MGEAAEVIKFASLEDEERYHSRVRRGRAPGAAAGSDARPGAAGRTLPHSLEAEEQLLSCCFVDGREVVGRAYAKGVREGAFYAAPHGLVWRALEKLWQEQKPIEVACVAEELKVARQLDAVGGYAFLTQVSGLIPTTAQASYFIERVLEQAELRAVIREASGAVENCYNYAGGGLANDERLVASLDRLQGLRVRAQRDLPAIMSDGQFEAADLPIPAQLVEGVMHIGRRTLIVAPSKASKTFTAMHLGICIAKGLPWLGFKTHQAPVLHIDFELPTWGLKDRRRVLCELLGVKGGLDMDWWSLDGYQRSIDELLPLITARAPFGKFGMITLEPAYVIMGRRDENDNADVTDYMNRLAWLARITGSAILCTHHFAKGDASKKDAKDRASGAASWIRAPDTAIVLSPIDDAEQQTEDAYRMEFIERNMKRHAPLAVRFEYPVFRLASGLDVNALREPGRPRESTEADVVAMLGDEQLTHGQWLRLAEKRGMSERTFNRRVKEALTAELVTQNGPIYSRPKQT